METELSKKLVIRLRDLQTCTVADNLNSHDQQQKKYHADESNVNTNIQLSKSVCSLPNDRSRNVNGLEKKNFKDKKLVVELCDFMVCSRKNCDVPKYKKHKRKVKRMKFKALISSEDETSDFEEVSNGKRFCRVKDNSDKEISYIKKSENDKEDSDYKEEEDDSDCEESTVTEEDDSDWEETYVAKKRREKEKKVKKEKSGKKYKEKEKIKKTENLSNFELERQNNLNDKMAFLKSLQISEIVDELEGTAKEIKKRNIKPKVILDVLRKSKRMENFNIDLSEKAVAKRFKIEETVIEKPEIPSIFSFEDAFSGEEKSLLHNFDRYFQKFSIKEEPTTSNFPLDLGRVNPMPYTSYNHSFMHSSVDFHPAVDRTIILSGSTRGQISLWNVNTEPFIFSPHNGCVTLVKVSPKCPTRVISSSSDGTLRQTDIEKKCFEQIFREDTACKYFDFISQNEILVARSDGCISLIDCREKRFRSGSKMGFQCARWKCSDGQIRTVSAHPIKQDLCLALDSYGSINLWDRRYLKMCVTHAVTADSNVLTAFFSPVNGNSVLCSSKESLCIYDSTHLEEKLNMRLKFNILHTSNNHGRRLPKGPKNCINSLHISGSTFYTMATWMPSSDEAFLVCNNHLKKTMILNSQDGHEMSSLNTSGVSTLQAVHPIQNIISVINGTGLRINLYQGEVCT